MAEAFALAGGVVAFLDISVKIGKRFREIRKLANDLPDDLEGCKIRIECLAGAARRLQRILHAEINNVPVEGPLGELFSNIQPLFSRGKDKVNDLSRLLDRLQNTPSSTLKRAIKMVKEEGTIRKSEKALDEICQAIEFQFGVDNLINNGEMRDIYDHLRADLISQGERMQEKSSSEHIRTRREIASEHASTRREITNELVSTKLAITYSTHSLQQIIESRMADSDDRTRSILLQLVHSQQDFSRHMESLDMKLNNAFYLRDFTAVVDLQNQMSDSQLMTNSILHDLQHKDMKDTFEFRQLSSLVVQLSQRLNKVESFMALYVSRTDQPVPENLSGSNQRKSVSNGMLVRGTLEDMPEPQTGGPILIFYSIVLLFILVKLLVHLVNSESTRSRLWSLIQRIWYDPTVTISGVLIVTLGILVYYKVESDREGRNWLERLQQALEQRQKKEKGDSHRPDERRRQGKQEQRHERREQRETTAI